MNDRIGFHNDPDKRARHPSLHYHMWERLKEMHGFDSIFVKLASFEQFSRDPIWQLPLNLEEMFMACVFTSVETI